jgi:DNA replication licensing factor MCM4
VNRLLALTAFTSIVYPSRAPQNRGAKTITATTRQLESLIRLAQALAKMRLSDAVLPADVDEAIRLMKVPLLALPHEPPSIQF